MGSKSKVQTETLEVKHTELPSGWEIKHFSDIALIDNNSLKSDTPENYVFNYISLSDVDSEDFKI